jgi:excinuclease ABC subunit A
VPLVAHKLGVLNRLGMGYLKLGQSSTTISGGEAQRVKLAHELGKVKRGGRNLYILDEPTTGLHLADIQRLLDALNQLVDAGNTVVVIEHHLDVIKTADWIIDLGPEGGKHGGRIVAQGPPEAIAGCPHSTTGQFLRRVLQ